MKLKATHQLLVYVDDVNVLLGSMRAINKTVTDVLLVSSKEIRLGVGAEKSKYRIC